MTLFAASTKTVTSPHNIEAQDINKILLKTIRLSEIKDANKKLIKITLPSSNILLLKAGSASDHVVWYNNIYITTVHARANTRLRDLSALTNNLEQMNAETDRKTLSSLFSSVEEMLKVKETRNMLFERLTSQNLRYKFLGNLYTLIIKYKEFCEYEQYTYAFMKLNKIHKMLTTFSIDDDKTEESRLTKSAQPINHNTNLKALVKEIFPLSIKLLLGKIVSQKDIKNLKKDFFNDAEARIITTFSNTYRSTLKNTSFECEKDQMMKIPLVRHKRSFYYAPTLKFITTLFKGEEPFETLGTLKPIEYTKSSSFTGIKDQESFCLSQHQA